MTPAADSGAVHRYAFVAMASRHELVVATPDRVQADRAARAAIADVLRIEAKFTSYRDTSVTSTINRNAGGAAVPIDAETAALLRYADRCHALSEGRFDVTSGVLRRAWDFKRHPPRVPDDAEIDALLAQVGWPRVEWGEHSIRLPEAGIDLREHIAQIELNLIRDALDRAGGVVAHAAQLLGLRRTTLVEKLRKYGIEREDVALATEN